MLMSTLMSMLAQSPFEYSGSFLRELRHLDTQGALGGLSGTWTFKVLWNLSTPALGHSGTRGTSFSRLAEI